MKPEGAINPLAGQHRYFTLSAESKHYWVSATSKCYNSLFIPIFEILVLNKLLFSCFLHFSSGTNRAFTHFSLLAVLVIS
jgi:hypothetical protein